MKNITELQEQLFGIQDDTLLGMMRELFEVFPERGLAFTQKHPNSTFSKSVINGMQVNDSEHEKEINRITEAFYSENENALSRVRNYKTKIFGDFSETISVLSEINSEKPSEETIQKLLDENAANKKIQDFYGFYTAFKNQTHIDKINQDMISFLLKNNAESDKEKLLNWLLFASVFEFYTDDSNFFLSQLNVELANFIFTDDKVFHDNLKKMDLFVLYRQFFINKKMMYKNIWIFFALYQVLLKLNEEEFNIVFKKKSIILSYSYELLIKVCELAGYPVPPASELLNPSFHENICGVNLLDKSEEHPDNGIDFLYVLYLVCYYNFLKQAYDNFSKYENTFLEVFFSGMEKSFKEYITILNKIAKEMKITKVNPFNMLNLYEAENKQDIEDALVILIFTFKNYSNDRKLDIIHLINFIDNKQKKKFPVEFDCNKRYETEDKALKYYETIQKTRDKLAEIDCGFMLNMEQTLQFLRFSDTNLYIDRTMKLKVFLESDMKLHSINDEELDYIDTLLGAKKVSESSAGVSWKNKKPLENFRSKHKKFLDTIYLYQIRNQETHFCDNSIILNLLKDSKNSKSRMCQLLEALYDGINKLTELEKNKKNQIATLYFWFNSLDLILKEIFEQTDKITLGNKDFISELFTEAGILKPEITDTVLNEIKLSPPDLPEVMYDNLKELLNFMYGIHPHLLENFRFPIMFYLIYLTVQISSYKEKTPETCYNEVE